MGRNQIKNYERNEELFNILRGTHLSIGHEDRNKMEHQLRNVVVG